MTKIADGIYTNLSQSEVDTLTIPAWDGLPYWNEVEGKWEL